MVAAVRHHNVPLGGEGEALGAVQGTAQGVHVGEEWPELVKHLDPELKGTLEFFGEFRISWAKSVDDVMVRVLMG